jgi:hypothetical protein
MSQDGVTSAEDYNNLWEQRFWAKEGGLKAGEVRRAAPPAVPRCCGVSNRVQRTNQGTHHHPSNVHR